MQNGRCVKDFLFIPFHLKMSNSEFKEKKEEQTIVCPDNKMECKQTQTCCQLSDNSYGCCPMANAVCCDDKYLK